MPPVEITEIDDLEAMRVDGVVKPASGIPFLLLKQLGDTDLAAAVEPLAGDAPAVEPPAVVEPGAVGDAEPAPDAEPEPAAEPEPVATDEAAKDLGDGEPGGELDDGLDPADNADPSVIGSAAWEAEDAQALIAAGQQLARLAAQLEISLDREEIEYSTGNADDWSDVDALWYAVDCVNTALSLVAALAFREGVEAELEKAERVTSLEQLTKARDALIALVGIPPTSEEDSDMAKAEAFINWAKSAAADDASDEDRAELEGVRKALGIPDEFLTPEQVDEKITEATKALEGELAEVKELAAPGGPVRTRTSMADVAKAAQHDQLQSEAARYRDIASKATDRELRDSYLAKAREVEGEIARLTPPPVDE